MTRDASSSVRSFDVNVVPFGSFSDQSMKSSRFCRVASSLPFTPHSPNRAIIFLRCAVLIIGGSSVFSTGTSAAAEVPVENTDDPPMISTAQRKKMMALFGECGVKGNDDATRQKRLDFIDWSLKLPKGTTLTSNDLTELEASLVIEALNARRAQLVGASS